MPKTTDDLGHAPENPIPANTSWDSKHVLLYLFVALVFFAALLLSLTISEPKELKDILRDIAIAVGPVWMLGLLYQHFLFKEIRLASSQASADALLRQTQPLIDSIKASAREVQTEVENMMHLRELGIQRAFRTRKDAMPLVLHWLRAEKAEIAIVGTSLRGFFWEEVGDPEVAEIFKAKAKEQNRSLKFKIILTHPAFSDLRQKLERLHRPEDFQISMEIRESVERLLEFGIKPAEIHFARATPTCFAIKTTSYMLINPYPIENQALASFCIIVGNDEGRNQIYSSFAENHFVFDSANCTRLAGGTPGDIDRVFSETLEHLGAYAPPDHGKAHR